jgi:hypothetical protein
MAIWDFIGIPLENSKSAKSIINSSYSSIIGDSLAFVIGGGRATNIYGGDCKMVIDWEKLFEMLGEKYAETFMKYFGGLIFGLGGDTSVVFGDKNAFTYEGTDFTSKRARTKYERTAKELGIPIPLTLALGSMGLLAAALVLRFKYGVYNSSQKNSATWDEDTQGKALDLGMTLIVTLQPRWLGLMQSLEKFLFIADAATKSQMEVDVAALEQKLADAKKALKTAEVELAAEQAKIAKITPPPITTPASLIRCQMIVSSAQKEFNKAYEAYTYSFKRIQLDFATVSL